MASDEDEDEDEAVLGYANEESKNCRDHYAFISHTLRWSAPKAICSSSAYVFIPTFRTFAH